MKKERNRRGKLIGSQFTQVIVEKKFKKDGKPNPRYPGTRMVRHYLTPKQ